MLKTDLEYNQNAIRKQLERDSNKIDNFGRTRSTVLNHTLKYFCSSGNQRKTRSGIFRNFPDSFDQAWCSRGNVENNNDYFACLNEKKILAQIKQKKLIVIFSINLKGKIKCPQAKHLPVLKIEFDIFQFKTFEFETLEFES